MIEIPGRIPLAIHPFFWVFAALIGWLNSGSPLGALIWVEGSHTFLKFFLPGIRAGSSCKSTSVFENSYVIE